MGRSMEAWAQQCDPLLLTMPPQCFRESPRTRSPRDPATLGAAAGGAAGAQSSVAPRLTNHWSAGIQGICRPPPTHFDLPRKARGESCPPPKTDPIAFSHMSGLGAMSPRAVRRIGYESPSARGTWKLASSAANGENPNAPVEDDGLYKQLVTRVARHRKPEHMAGSEDLLPAARQRFVKSDAPASKACARQNDQRHLMTFEWGKRPVNQHLLLSPEMVDCLAGPSEAAATPRCEASCASMPTVGTASNVAAMPRREVEAARAAPVARRFQPVGGSQRDPPGLEANEVQPPLKLFTDPVREARFENVGDASSLASNGRGQRPGYSVGAASPGVAACLGSASGVGGAVGHGATSGHHATPGHAAAAACGRSSSGRFGNRGVAVIDGRGKGKIATVASAAAAAASRVGGTTAACGSGEAGGFGARSPRGCSDSGSADVRSPRISGEHGSSVMKSLPPRVALIDLVADSAARVVG